MLSSWNFKLTAMASVVPAGQVFAIVEDEPLVAKIVRDMLASGGANAEIFHLGSDFLKSDNLAAFKAIILDLSLPDLDGFDVMTMLADNYSGVLVLLISGHNNEVLQAAAMHGTGLGLKMGEGLKKPFNKDELFAVLKMFV